MRCTLEYGYPCLLIAAAAAATVHIINFVSTR